MVHPVVGRRKDKFMQEPQPAIFNQLLANMYEPAPETINKHNDE